MAYLVVCLILCAVPLVTSSASFCKPKNENLQRNFPEIWQNDTAYFKTFFPYIDVVHPTGDLNGNQNLTWCCVAAVQTYLRNNCTNTSSAQVDESILEPGRQFPCGATFDGNLTGAPLVTVSYNWTTTNCKGWQLSRASSITQWLETLVGFLLPSIVFSLNIPRGMKFPLPDMWFARGPWYRVAPFACLAILSAAVDTIAWLCIVFAMAGPLLLSGMYEAMLDYNVISYLQDRDDETHNAVAGTLANIRMPLAFRTRILFSILGGNLELSTAWKHVMLLAEGLDELDNPEIEREVSPRGSPLAASTPRPHDGSDTIDVSDSSSRKRSSSPSTTLEGTAYVQSHTPLNFRQWSQNHLTPEDVKVAGQDGEAVGIRVTEVTSPTQVSTPGLITPPLTMRKTMSALSGERQSDKPTFSQNEIPTPRNSSFYSQETREAHLRLLISRAVKQLKEKQKKEKRRQRAAFRTDARLKAMLACQYSFGSTVGAPIIFYVGAFVYTLFEILQTYGDNDVAHALAFGSWWMVIPHTAIVSGFLLGGNNPNTLSAMVGAMKESKLQYTLGAIKPNSVDQLEQEEKDHQSFVEDQDKTGSRYHEPLEDSIFPLLKKVYESSMYMPVSMWDRGRSKSEWLIILCADGWTSYADDEVRSEIVRFMCTAVMLSKRAMARVVLSTFLLLFIPCMLGWIVAYLTPQVGLSCRSLTFTVYMSVQLMMFVLWNVQMTWGSKYWRTARQINRIDRAGRCFTVLQDYGHRDVNVKGARESFPPEWKIAVPAFHGLMVVGGSVAIFSSIGGTLMQIIGVYRNCLCKLDIGKWLQRHRSDALLILSTNNQADIVSARHNWAIVGLVSIGFLAVMGYLGWWYQNRTRVNFNAVAGQLGKDIQSRVDELNPAKETGPAADEHAVEH